MLKPSSAVIFRSLLFTLFFAVLSFPVMARVWFDYLTGGHGWRQGDWLINFGSGLVRRGAIGEGLIAVSDITGLPLLVVVLIVQSAIFVALVFVLWLIALLHRTPEMLLFLAASPAFFPIFWASDLQGIMRKEIIGYLAFALVVIGSVLGGSRPVLALLAVTLFSVGCMGNIMHALMGAAMIAGLWLAWQGGQISARLFRWLAAITAVMAVFWMGFALLFREVADLAGICEPLLSRGLDSQICQDALRWLVTGEVDHLGQVKAKMTPAALTHYGLIAGLAAVPLLLSFTAFREKRLLAVLLLVTFPPMLPLYVIATDWGRWFSIPYTTFVLLVIQAHAVGRLSLIRLPSLYLVIPLLLAALFISHEHTIGWQPGGAVRSVISKVLDFM